MTETQNPILQITRSQENAEGETPTPDPHFELTTEIFTMPAVGSTVDLLVATSTLYQRGMFVWIRGIGYLEITAIPDTTHLTVENPGYSGNVDPGTTVATGTPIVADAPPLGSAADTGFAIFDQTSQVFTVPIFDGSSTATMNLVDGGWARPYMNIFVGENGLGSNAGWFQVVNVISTTQITVMAISRFNAPAGTTLSANAVVYPMITPDFEIDTDDLAYSGATGFKADVLGLNGVIPRTPGLSGVKIAHGLMGIQSLGSGAEASLATIDLTAIGFVGNPTVVACLERPGAPITTEISIFVANTTPTSFQIFGYQSSGGPVNVDATWIAIGV